MPYNAKQVDILDTERNSDPLLRGYDTMDDAQFLTSITTVDRTRNRTFMTGGEVKKQIDTTEFNALTEGQKQIILSMCARDDLDPFGLDADIVQDIFPGGGATITALVAARVENIARYEELGLPEPTLGDVQRTELIPPSPSPGAP